MEEIRAATEQQWKDVLPTDERLAGCGLNCAVTIHNE